MTRPSGWSSRTVVANAEHWAEGSDDKDAHGYFNQIKMAKLYLFYQVVPVILLELKLK